MITNLFKKKVTSAVEKMKFDEYFIQWVHGGFCLWYAVNYKNQTAISIQYDENGVMVYEIGWTSIEATTGNVQIPKAEFLEAYDRVIDYMKNARP